jgi:glycosyltransferase involved in cell wall biosynthesis
MESQQGPQKCSETDPLVTVLLPCYNSNETVLSALGSIRRQDYRNVEVILIDDCSKPMVPTSFVNDFSDINLTVIRNERNIGIVGSLNKGIEHSRGSIIFRLDADDQMLEGRISHQVDLLLTERADVVFGQMLINGRKNVYNYPISQQGVSSCMLYGNPIPHPAVAFKATILKKFRYEDFEGIRGLEDYYLWARMLKSKAVFIGSDRYVVDYSLSQYQTSRITAQNERYYEVKNMISQINTVRLTDFKRRYEFSSIFKDVKRLRGMDLKAFSQIAASSLRGEIRRINNTRRKISLFAIFVFVTLVRKIYKIKV